MRQKYYIMAIIIVILSICLFQSCEKDCPVCPESPVPESHYIYLSKFGDSFNTYVYIANSATNSLIDSFSVSSPIRDIAASSDGEYLAINLATDSILITRPQTAEIVRSIYLPNLETYGHPVFSNNGSSLLISSVNQQILSKYDIVTGAVISDDSIYFNIQGIANTNFYICTLAFTTSMTISNDDNFLYLISRPDKVYKYDIINDSILDSVVIFSQAYYGDLIGTHDDKYLLITEVTNNIYYNSMLGIVAVVKIEDFTTLKRIDTWGITFEKPVFPSLLGRIEITPDGSRAISAYEDSLYATPPVIFNIFDFTATSIEGIPGESNISAFAVGGRISE